MAAKGAVARTAASVRQASAAVPPSCIAPLQLLLDNLAASVYSLHGTEQGEHWQNCQSSTDHQPAAGTLAAGHSSAIDKAAFARLDRSFDFIVNAQLHAAAPWQPATPHQSPLSILCGRLQQPSRLCQYSSIPGGGGNDIGKDSSSNGGGSGSSASRGSSNSSEASSSSAAPPADSLAAALLAIAKSSKVAHLTPAAITQQLDKHIVGQAVRGASLDHLACFAVGRVQAGLWQKGGGCSRGC